jgi:LysR family hydrogen peroxide-inducible transcriptional activator
LDLSAVTLQQLRYLVALDRHRSFREAALASHVSQPALSMQLKKLEEMLGVGVFDRSRQPIVPTERGQRVIAQARLVLDQFEKIGAIAGRRELAGTYRLAVIPTLAPTFVPLFLPSFARAYPRVDLEVVEMQTTSILRGLREGTVDGALASIPLDVPGIRERLICKERLVAYLPPAHELLARPRIRQADLMEERVWLLGDGHCFRTQVLHLCSADRRRPAGRGANVTFEGAGFEAIIGLVDAGFGVTVLPELVVRSLPPSKADRARPFAAPEPVRAVGFVASRADARDDVADALFDLLRQGASPGRLAPPRRSTVVSPTRPPRKLRRAPST